MSEASLSLPEFITELQVSAHLMQLEAGVYCVFHSAGSPPPDPATGLPGARLSLPPGRNGGQGVTITGFSEDGWLGTLDAAALIRVTKGPAQVLMTVYQLPNSGQPAPKFQVTRLVDGAHQAVAPAMEAPAATPAEAVPEPAPAGDEPEIAAHVQARGDVLARMGEWVGEPGSKRWVEGFAVAPRRAGLAAEDIEYQAVLGRGWLSPWAEGGQYCGSRGMALPILGLRVRLRGKAAAAFRLQVSASFTDGSQIGPVGDGDACEADSLAALEAFRIELVPASEAEAPVEMQDAANPPAATGPAAPRVPVH